MDGRQRLSLQLTEPFRSGRRYVPFYKATTEKGAHKVSFGGNELSRTVMDMQSRHSQYPKLQIKEVTMCKIMLTLLAVMLLLPAAALQAQVVSFDGQAGNFVIGLAEPNENSATATDNFDEFVEGVGSLEVSVALRNYAFSWGTWTDFRYDLPDTVDLGNADEIRFWVKVLQGPSTGAPACYPCPRAIQFTMDLFDYGPGATGGELWRYPEDLDIFYNENIDDDGWFEVIVPLSRFIMPVWSPPQNGVLDKDRITTFAFGVHGDSTAADSVVFLIDDLRGFSVVRVGQLFSFDDNSGFLIGLAEPLENVVTVEDNFDDFEEGVGSAEIKVALRNYGFPWGTWTDVKLDFPAPMDVSGATEIRFKMKIVELPIYRKSLQMTYDLFDFPTGAPGNELWRWPAQYGTFSGNDRTTEWREMVFPINDMLIPSWFPPQNAAFDAGFVSTIAFGVHGDSSNVDSLIILMDDLYATYGTPSVVSVDDGLEPGVPNAFRVGQNYPNPFNPSTTIRYTLNQSGPVSLKIYSMTGQLVQTVLDNVDGEVGTHQVQVDMSRYASGIYSYVLQQGDKRDVRFMTFLK